MERWDFDYNHGCTKLEKRGAAEEIHIVTYHYLIGIPNTGTHKLIVLHASDTLRACIASGMNLVSDTNTGPGYGS